MIIFGILFLGFLSKTAFGFYLNKPESTVHYGYYRDILPEMCRPLTTRLIGMPCHGYDAKNHPRNGVCNNDFLATGTIKIYSDYPVFQQKFEGVRIWKG